MKVLQITGTLEVGGLENVASNIARYAPDHIQVDYLVYGPDQGASFRQELENLGSTIHMIEGPSRNPLSYIRNLAHLIQAEHYDLIHVHSYTSSGFAILAAQHAGLDNIVVHSHTESSGRRPNFLNRSYEALMKRIIRKSASVKIAVGDIAGQALFGDNYLIIHNGINIDEFSYDSHKREKIREQLHIHSEIKLIGHVGRLAPVKNQGFLIDLIARDRDQGGNLIACLVGEGGDYEVALKQQVANLKLEDRVLFLGYQEDTASILSAFDAIVFPSLYEGVPLALIEAQANGLPILASDTIDMHTDITGLVDFLALDEKPQVWLDNVRRLERKQVLTELPSEYNVLVNMQEIYEIYENLCE